MKLVKLLAVNISEMTLEKLLNGRFFFSFIKKISCQTGSDTFFFCQTIGLKSCRINLWGETVITHFLCFLLSQIISRSSVFHHHFYLLNWSKYTGQDFLCKLGMKPHMDLVEISLFSINHVITRPIKIIKDLCKAST